MRVSRTIFTNAAWLFVAGVVAQVYFAGMAVVARQWSWENHIGFGHLLAAPLLVMLVSMYVAKLPVRMKRLTWLLVVVYILQADVLIFMRSSVPACPIPNTSRARPRYFEIGAFLLYMVAIE